MVDKTVGDLIREIRNEIGISQSELSIMAHVGKRTISKWENGESLPSMASIAAVEDIFSRYKRSLIDRARLAGIVISDEYSSDSERQQFVKRLSAAMSRSAISVGELADRADISNRTLRQIMDGETGGRRTAEIERVAASLDVPPSWLYGVGDDEPVPRHSRSYFNLLVVPRASRRHISMTVSAEKLRYWTHRKVAEYFNIREKVAIVGVTSIPTLLLTFDQEENIAQIGRIDTVAIKGNNINLSYSHDNSYQDISIVVLQKNLISSGIDPREFGDFHWSIKVGDLDSLLVAAGVGKVAEVSEASEDDLLALTQRPSAFQFESREGRIFAEPLGGSSPSAAGSDLRLELLEKAADLLAKLAKTQAPVHVSDTLRRLVEALADRFEDIRPGILLSRARSIEAAIAVFDTPEARQELFTDTQSLLRDVGASLADLMALFPEILAIESNRLALQITSERSSEILSASIEITEIARSSSSVDDSALTALEMTAVDIRETDTLIVEARNDAVRAAAWEARGRLVAQRLLDIRNFAASAINAGRRESGKYASEAAGVMRKASLEGLEGAVKEVSKGAVKGTIIYLVYQMLGPIFALSMVIGSFAPLSRKAKELTDNQIEE